MIQRQNRLNPCCDQIVDEIDVVLNTNLIHRIIPATKRDYTGPGDAETVGSGAKGFEKGYVFAGATIRITRNGAVGAIGYLAGFGSERIPDRGAPTVG